MAVREVGVMPHVLPSLHRLVSHPAFLVCGVVGLAGAAMDLDHLVPGLSRQTHLLVAVTAWAGLGLYVALHSRHSPVGVLGVADVSTSINVKVLPPPFEAQIEDGTIERIMLEG